MDGPTVPKCIFASLPRTVRGRALVLGGDPKNKNFLYTNGNTVYIRDIANPLNCDVYTQHSNPVNVAKYNPVGTYIASGDERGKIRIWDTTQKEHILKYEYQPLSAVVMDIAWTPDSKRIAVVGEGREKRASVFLWDSGSSVGALEGHAKRINSVDIRPERPYKAVTASEDYKLCFFDGPPYKYKHSMSDHTNFVNCVRYSPDGSHIVSGSSDGRAFVYDGKTGEKVRELGSPKAHKGGIYAVSFSPDSSQVLTASGDKSCKIFSVESGECVVEFVMGTEVENQQLGCLWQGEYLISVSLSGHINYLDRNNPDTPSRIIKGHSKIITAMCISEDRTTIYTGGSDSLINLWDPVTGDCESIRGKGHSNQIQDMAVVDNTLISVSMDDTIRFTSTEAKEYSVSTKLSSQPKAVSAFEGGLVVVACMNEVVVIRNQRIVSSLTVDYEPSSVAIHPGQTEVVVGGAKDTSVHTYCLNNNTLEEGRVLKQTGGINDLKYSPDGAYLAATDANRRVTLYTLPDYEVKAESSMHTSRVTSAAWTSNSRYLATGGLDTNICVFDVNNFSEPVVIRNAHLQSPITRVGWITDNTVVSVAHDSTVRQWDIAH